MPKPRYWLLKSEPDVFSLDDLKKLGRTDWDGVRNYQARNFMQEMKVGDLALFYHSRAEPPAAVGVCRISREAAPDLTAQDPKHKYHDPKATPQNPIWMCVQVEYVEHLARPVTLPELKSEPGLAKMELTRKGSRLSVQPIRPKEWEVVMGLARQPAPEAAPAPKPEAASKKAAPAKAASKKPKAETRAASGKPGKGGLAGALSKFADKLARGAADLVDTFAKAARSAGRAQSEDAKRRAAAEKAASKAKKAAPGTKPRPADKAKTSTPGKKPAGKAAAPEETPPAAGASKKPRPAAGKPEKPAGRPEKTAGKPGKPAGKPGKPAGKPKDSNRQK